MDGLLFLMAVVALVAPLIRESVNRGRIDRLERRVNEVERWTLVRKQETRRAASESGIPPIDAASAMGARAGEPWAPGPAAIDAAVAPPASQVPPAGVSKAPVSKAQVSKAQATPPPASPARHRAAPPAGPSSAELMAGSLWRLFSKNPFATAGVLLLLMGVGFLFALLAARNILPPIARVVLVGAGGAALFAAGLRADQKRPALAFNLQGGAIAVEFVCTLWAYGEYHLLTPAEAFVVLGLISAMAYLWSVLKKSFGHALIGLTGALATPVVTSTGHGTVSGLIVYCLWISLLSIGCGALLGSTMLAGLAMAGVIVLLEVARGAALGDAQVVVIGCIALSLTYTLAGLMWCYRNRVIADVERAAVIMQLVVPPLVLSQLLVTLTQMPLTDAALLPGSTGALLLFAVWRLDQSWRVWLLTLASILGFVGIALHFEGASQAVTFSAGAMGLVVIARSVQSPWLRFLALIYWLASAAVGIDELQSHHTLALDTATLVALAAAFLEKESAVSIVYLLGAPLLAGMATLNGFAGTIPNALLFMLVWTAVAFIVAELIGWKELERSTVWVVPAGTLMLMTSDWMGPGSLWFKREFVLLLWLLASSLVLRSLIDRPGQQKGASRCAATDVALVGFSVLIPIAVSVEVVRGLPMQHGATADAVPAALALVWSLAAWASRAHRAVAQRDQLTAGCIGLSLVLASASVLLTPLHPANEVMLIASLALLGMLHYANRLALILVLAAALVGLVLQLIGVSAHHVEPVIQLAFEADMQPWISLLWALCGLVVVAAGATAKRRSLWIAGAIALTGLVAKMFIVDLASLTLPAKVGTFMLVGVVFIALGYFCPLPPADGAVLEPEAV